MGFQDVYIALFCFGTKKILRIFGRLKSGDERLKNITISLLGLRPSGGAANLHTAAITPVPGGFTS